MQGWEFIRYVEKKIKEDEWSPDVVVGRAKKEGKHYYISSTKTLYNWIDQGK